MFSNNSARAHPAGNAINTLVHANNCERNPKDDETAGTYRKQAQNFLKGKNRKKEKLEVFVSGKIFHSLHEDACRFESSMRSDFPC